MEIHRKLIRDPAVLKRMETTFELCRAADEIMHQNLKRRFPDADANELARRLGEWKRKRPKDEHEHLVVRPRERWSFVE